MIKCLMDNLDGQSLLCISNNCWKKSSIVHDLYCPYLNSIEDMIKKNIKIDRSTIIRRITYESRKIKINRLYHYTYAMTYVYGTKMITERQWIPTLLFLLFTVRVSWSWYNETRVLRVLGDLAWISSETQDREGCKLINYCNYLERV